MNFIQVRPWGTRIVFALKNYYVWRFLEVPNLEAKRPLRNHFGSEAAVNYNGYISGVYLSWTP